jgi:hypothetical protein
VNFVKVGVGKAKANAVDGVEVVENGVMELRRKIKQGVVLGGLGLSLWDRLIVHNRV